MIAEFLDKIDKTKTCWLWTGSKNNKGYGTFWMGGKNKSAHRISYEFYKGRIPKQLCIDHLCRNPGCVNPDHLEAVTLKENTLRGLGTGAINKRKTHCLRGHEFTIENTHIRNDGGRFCRKCNQVRTKYFFEKRGGRWATMTEEQKQKSSKRVKAWKEKKIPKAVKKTHCIHGHSLANAFIKKNGTRSCRECDRIKSAERRHLRSLAKR